MPVTGSIAGEWWYIYRMVTAREISPEQFRARRILANHKQSSLAMALHCSEKTIRNFETKKTAALQSVRWEELAKELGIPQ